MPESRLLIHVGYPKTGSTWLQHTVFDDKNAGFVRPWTSQSNIGGADRVIDEFIIANAFSFNPQLTRKIFEPGLQRAITQNCVPVLSEELLVGNHVHGKYWGKEVADRLHNVFPEAKILIFIREQKAMIKSSYGQYLKPGGTATIQRYIGSGGTQRSGFGPICQLDYLEYNFLIEYYQNVFGEKNVLVLPFELLKMDQLTVANRIIRFAGSKGTFENIQTPARNVGFKGATFAIRRILNVFCAPFDSYGGSNIPLTWRIANKLSFFTDRLLPQYIHERGGQKLEHLISEGVGDFFRESNQRTSNMIGINLTDLGYDC